MRFAAIALLILTIASAKAETLLDRAKRDDLAFVAKDDPEMAAAISKARERLPEFLKLARAPKRMMRAFAVKVAVVEGENAEFFWISPFEERRNEFAGQINNTPQLVKKVRLGQTITFRREEIVDWLYQDGRTMQGNFTACVLLKREPRDQAEEFMKQLGLRCEP